MPKVPTRVARMDPNRRHAAYQEQPGRMAIEHTAHATTAEFCYRPMVTLSRILSSVSTLIEFGDPLVPYSWRPPVGLINTRSLQLL
jgi:hypothetical protein